MMNHAYLAVKDVVEIYRQVKGSKKGVTAFVNDAKKIASITKEGAYIFVDEEALFDVFLKHLKDELENLRIDCFGRLMQFID